MKNDAQKKMTIMTVGKLYQRKRGKYLRNQEVILKLVKSHNTIISTI